MPPIFAACSRELPSSTAAIASSRRACAAFFTRCATRRTSPLVQSVRTTMARPMANDPPFATLNHFTDDLGIPSESVSLRIGISRLDDWPVILGAERVGFVVYDLEARGGKELSANIGGFDAVLVRYVDHRDL